MTGERSAAARWPANIRWVLWSLAVLLALASAAMLYLNRETTLPASWAVAAGPRSDPIVLFDKLFFLAVYTGLASALGVLIIGRRPRNQIGWLLCAGGLFAALQSLVTEYTIYGLITAPGSLPAANLVAWVVNWIWVPIVAVSMWVALAFPDGDLAHAGWQPGVWFAAVAMVAVGLLSMIEQPMSSAFYLSNPLPLPDETGWRMTAEYFGYLIFALSIAGTAASVVVRFRRARGLERQQFKWLVAAMIAGAILIPASLIWVIFFHGEAVGGVVVDLAFALLPLAVGVAVLQYRLYDIDLIINRTLVYGVLSAALALVYFGSVILLQALFRSLTGQASQLAIVASTLTIAVLFSPLRRQVQDFIDRRFYRRKYDAAQALAEFAATARDETDLDQLAGRLLGVVEETMQPAGVSLWLANSPSTKRGGGQ